MVTLCRLPLHCCQPCLPRHRQQCGLAAADRLTTLWKLDSENFFCRPGADTREHLLLVVSGFTEFQIARPRPDIDTGASLSAVQTGLQPNGNPPSTRSGHRTALQTAVIDLAEKISSSHSTAEIPISCWRSAVQRERSFRVVLQFMRNSGE